MPRYNSSLSEMTDKKWGVMFFAHDTENCIYQVDGRQASCLQMSLGASMVSTGDVEIDLYRCMRNSSERMETLECFMCTIKGTEEIFNKLHRHFPGLQKELNRELSGGAHD